MSPLCLASLSLGSQPLLPIGTALRELWNSTVKQGGGTPMRIRVKLWPLELQVARILLPFSRHTHVRLEQNIYSAQVGVGVKIDYTIIL